MTSLFNDIILRQLQFGKQIKSKSVEVFAT